jgi:hypothetical protein
MYAAIDNDGVRIVTNREKKSGEMKFTLGQMELIQEGMKLVDAYWHTDRLPSRHVLLECGCMIDWDKDHHTLHPKYHLFYAIEENQYQTETWCPDHEEQSILRYNEEDFPAIKIPHRHVLLRCGNMLLWENKENPFVEKEVFCLHHDNDFHTCKVVDFNAADFPDVPVALSQE